MHGEAAVWGDAPHCTKYSVPKKAVFTMLVGVQWQGRLHALSYALRGSFVTSCVCISSTHIFFIWVSFPLRSMSSFLPYCCMSHFLFSSKLSLHWSLSDIRVLLGQFLPPFPSVSSLPPHPRPLSLPVTWSKVVCCLDLMGMLLFYFFFLFLCFNRSKKYILFKHV